MEGFDRSVVQNMVYAGTLHKTLRICLEDYETERNPKLETLNLKPKTLN